MINVESLKKKEAELEAKIIKATAARMALPFGSSRARVTTCNARLNTLLEARQRVWEELERIK